MIWKPVFVSALLSLTIGCSSDKESAKETSSKDIDMKSMVDEAGVSFARKQLTELDARLASDDPGSASSICSVIKPDMPAIEKADAELAKTLTQRCGHDVAVRSLTRFVEKLEVEHAADPDGFLIDCSSLSIYMKTVIAAKADKEAEVTELIARHTKVCPAKD